MTSTIDLAATPLQSGSWDETFAVLASAGLPGGYVLNTGGGCLVIEVRLDNGGALWVSGAEDNIGSVPASREVDDETGEGFVLVGEGWGVGYYCRECLEEGDCGKRDENTHAFSSTESSTYGDLLALVQTVLRDSAK